MADRTPYILLAFANPHQVPDAYLPALNQESARVYESLEAFALEDTCDVNRIPDATVEMIFNTVERWQKRKDLVLFHYGGHASGEGLFLANGEGESRHTGARGLAELLGSLPHLQLVFLNGCSTRGQVELLLASGVKAVIATSVAVQDEMAVDFADRFYQNLAAGETVETSFDQARKFTLAKYNKEVLPPGESRSLLFGMPANEPASHELPWGLYSSESATDVLQWRLPERKLHRSQEEKVREQQQSEALLREIREGFEAMHRKPSGKLRLLWLVIALVCIGGAWGTWKYFSQGEETFSGESTVTGTIRDMDGNPVNGARVLFGDGEDTTDQLGDFEVSLPLEAGHRARLRVIYQDREIYNGEELVSPNPLNIMVSPDE